MKRIQTSSLCVLTMCFAFLGFASEKSNRNNILYIQLLPQELYIHVLKQLEKSQECIEVFSRWQCVNTEFYRFFATNTQVHKFLAQVFKKAYKDPLRKAMDLKEPEVAKILSKDPEINIHAIDENKSSALHRAAQRGFFEVTKNVIARGGCPKALNIYGYSPFVYAVYYGQKEIADFLIDKKVDARGLTDVHLAACYGQLKKLKESFYESKNIIEIKDKLDCTPLHCAVMNGHTDIVEFLLDKGANIASKVHRGFTVLHFAIWRGHENLMYLLHKKGADINAISDCGSTLLHFAIEKRNKSIVEFLLENDVPLDAKNRFGYASLHLAVLKGDKKTVDLLLQKGASVNARARSLKTPLHLAVSVGNIKVCQLLLDYGAAVDPIDLWGKTPLYIAAKRCHNEIFLKLLHYKANPSIKRNGITVLHYVIKKNNFALTKILLHHGVDIESIGNGTPLHSAVLMGNRKIVQLLLNHHAKIEARDLGGETPLHNAARKGYVEIGKLLLENGGNIEAKDPYGYRPLHFAAIKGQSTFVQLLLKK